MSLQSSIRERVEDYIYREQEEVNLRHPPDWFTAEKLVTKESN